MKEQGRKENDGGLGPSFCGCDSLPSAIPRPSLSSPRPPWIHPVRQLPNQRRLHFHPFPHLLRPNLPLHLRPSTSHLHLTIGSPFFAYFQIRGTYTLFLPLISLSNSRFCLCSRLLFAISRSIFISMASLSRREVKLSAVERRRTAYIQSAKPYCCNLCAVC